MACSGIAMVHFLFSHLKLFLSFFGSQVHGFPVLCVTSKMSCAHFLDSYLSVRYSKVESLQ